MENNHIDDTSPSNGDSLLEKGVCVLEGVVNTQSGLIKIIDRILKLITFLMHWLTVVSFLLIIFIWKIQFQGELLNILVNQWPQLVDKVGNIISWVVGLVISAFIAMLVHILFEEKVKAMIKMLFKE